MSWLSWCAAEIPPRSPAWSTRVGAGLEVVAYAAALQAVLVARGTARYYVNPAGDAVLAVSAGRSGWCLEDHVSARPGTGQGRALRAVVLPQLLAAADADRIEIHTTAATSTLARLYTSEIPGLVDEGRGWPRGRRLRRRPAAVGAGPG